MTGGTLSVKIAALVIALSVVTGFATGSVTYAKFNDTEEATVSISAATDWEENSTKEATGSLSNISFTTTPTPIPTSSGVFTVRIQLGETKWGEVTGATLRVKGSKASVIHAKKIVTPTNVSANDTRELQAKFSTQLLALYSPKVERLDATLELTFDERSPVTTNGTIRLTQAKKADATKEADTEDANNKSAQNNSTTNATELTVPDHIPNGTNVPAKGNVSGNESGSNQSRTNDTRPVGNATSNSTANLSVSGNKTQGNETNLEGNRSDSDSNTSDNSNVTDIGNMANKTDVNGTNDGDLSNETIEGVDGPSNSTNATNETDDGSELNGTDSNTSVDGNESDTSDTTNITEDDSGNTSDVTENETDVGDGNVTDTDDNINKTTDNDTDTEQPKNETDSGDSGAENETDVNESTTALVPFEPKASPVTNLQHIGPMNFGALIPAKRIGIETVSAHIRDIIPARSQTV